MKHLNPRQGITTYTPVTHRHHSPTSARCETPKSPPGDYNQHLPRPTRYRLARRKCETPKSPPGDYNRIARSRPARGRSGVKHLNPRQGITTKLAVGRHHAAQPQTIRCETPKSPPGDYNRLKYLLLTFFDVTLCETPKSPPGDYNNATATPNSIINTECETPKSPPGDYKVVGTSTKSSE